MTNPFLIDLIKRIAKDNPRFFKIIQLVAVGVGAVSAAFSFIDKTHTALPPWLCWLEHSEVWVSSIVAAILAQLPNSTVNQVADQNKEKK